MPKNRAVGTFPVKGGKDAVVRYAELKDLDSIFEIIRDRRREFEKMGQDYREVSEEEMAIWRAGIHKSGVVILVVELGGKVVGHTHFGMNQQYAENAAYVYSLTVLAKHRRKGLGRALLLSGTSESEVALKAKIAVLHVAMTNPARKLYLKSGFLQEGEPFQSTWLGKPVLRIKMVKHL